MVSAAPPSLDADSAKLFLDTVVQVGAVCLGQCKQR